MDEAPPFDKPTIHGGNLPVINFGTDDQTMTWPALTGVASYNIYRGDLASLRITGPNGLPAAGYGTCASLADTSTTDTTFVDGAMPEPGHGFFYLKSAFDGHGEERGMGATSDGRARTVLVPCPR